MAQRGVPLPLSLESCQVPRFTVPEWLPTVLVSMSQSENEYQLPSETPLSSLSTTLAYRSKLSSDRTLKLNEPSLAACVEPRLSSNQ